VSIDEPHVDVPDPLDEVLRDAAAAIAEQNGPVVDVDSPLEPPRAEVAPVAPEPSSTPKAPIESAADAAESASDNGSPAVKEGRVPAVDGPAVRDNSNAQVSATPPVAAGAAVKTAPLIEKGSASAAPQTPLTDWLRSRNPGHYTLQLVGARDRASIDRFVLRHAIKQPYAVFSRTLSGAPWYSLVVGDFPDRNAAVAARAALPAALAGSGIWPRTFGSIHKLLK
jgi:septal ring-binding cell division protein DamX